jgi:hypothetical protein
MPQIFAAAEFSQERGQNSQAEQLKMSDKRGVQENFTAVRRAIPHLRWWIAAVLFASTIINYLDGAVS